MEKQELRISLYGIVALTSLFNIWKHKHLLDFADMFEFSLLLGLPLIGTLFVKKRPAITGMFFLFPIITEFLTESTLIYGPPLVTYLFALSIILAFIVSNENKTFYWSIIALIITIGLTIYMIWASLVASFGASMHLWILVLPILPLCIVIYALIKGPESSSNAQKAY